MTESRFVQPADGVVVMRKGMRAAGDLPGHEFHGNQWTTKSPEEREREIQSSDWHQDWEYSLLGDEKETIENYAGPDGRSEYINRHLRGAEERRTPRLDREINDLDSALAKASTDKPAQLLYRGVGSLDFARKLAPGVEFVDKGYVSTSLDLNHAKIFGASVLEIVTNRGAYISGITGPTNIDGMDVNEHEWLLPRGLRYRVESVRLVDGYRHARVSVL